MVQRHYKRPETNHKYTRYTSTYTATKVNNIRAVSNIYMNSIVLQHMKYARQQLKV